VTTSESGWAAQGQRRPWRSSGQTNDFLEAILTSLSSAIVVVDRDVRVEVWNRQAQELWGLRSDEVEGDHLMNLDIGLPVERLHQTIRACLVGEAPPAVTLPAVNRRGRAIEGHVRATPLLGIDRVIGAILLMDADDDLARPDAPADESATERQADPTT
jgi:two-component system, chemotaxis family, CheB/CheR fusion protein